MVTTAQPNGISIGLDSNPTIAGSNNSSKPVIHKPIPQNGERHTLEPETELRIEIPANTNGTGNYKKCQQERFVVLEFISVLNFHPLPQSYV